MTLNNVDSHKSKFGTGGGCDIEERARERGSILKTREAGQLLDGQRSFVITLHTGLVITQVQPLGPTNLIGQLNTLAILSAVVLL